MYGAQWEIGFRFIHEIVKQSVLWTKDKGSPNFIYSLIKSESRILKYAVMEQVNLTQSIETSYCSPSFENSEI